MTAPRHASRCSARSLWVSVAACALLGCGDSAAGGDGSVERFLREGEALLVAMEVGDADEIPRLANPWFARPRAILGGLDRLSQGVLEERTVTALANFVGLACRSYLEAPHFAKLERDERDEFLARARRAIYDLPPREGRYLLETLHRSGGLGPEHVGELVGFAELPGLLGPALNALSVIPSDAAQRRSAARRLYPVYSATEAALDPLTRDQALTLFLVGAHPESLVLLERRLAETADDEVWRRALTRRALVHPDSDAVLAVLERAWRGRAAPAIGFGVRFSQGLADHHVATSVVRFAGVEAPALRSLLLEIACLDDAFAEWLAVNGERCDDRAFALARMGETLQAPEERLRLARAVLLGSEHLVVRPGYGDFVAAVLALVEGLEGASRPEVAALVVRAIEGNERTRVRYADRALDWGARLKRPLGVSPGVSPGEQD